MRLTALVLLVLLVTACGGQTTSAAGSPNIAAEAPGWKPTADAPLSARRQAHAFWTGSSVLVIGGDPNGGCGPNEDCAGPFDPPLRDGAAYDPLTDTWSELPDAPAPLRHLSGAVLDGTLYVWISDIESAPDSHPAFLSFTPGDDAWQELTAPAVDQHANLHLVAADDRIVAYHASQENGVRPDVAYDPATNEWTDLPIDPLAPTFDRSMLWTDVGLVAIGVAVEPQPNSTEPSVYGAARFDLATGEWQRYGNSEIVASSPTWAWTADRLINPSIGRSDGGETNNWGRFYPHGGTLEPESGTWGTLPEPPAEPGALQGVSAAGEEWVVSSDGWALHVRSGTWVELTAPANAPLDTAATWAGDRLFVWGGTTIDGELLDDGWTWEPAAGS